MSDQIQLLPKSPGISLQSVCLPALIQNAGDDAAKKYVEFFAASIRNPGTRARYSLAAREFFDWCEVAGLRFEQIEPIVVAAYIESLTTCYQAPTVKLRLAAIRSLYDFLVTRQVVPFNPAASVRGPKHVVKVGKTPVLSSMETRQLLDSIDTSKVIGLRDRALVGVLVFSFARISAVLKMNCDDYLPQGSHMYLQLHEKGSKHHRVAVHRLAEAYLNEYLLVAGRALEKGSPLFRTVAHGRLTSNRLSRSDALRMIKRRAEAAGLHARVCCHTFRATGITSYLENGGTLEKAMQIACHESARTTKLYDRTNETVELEEIERITI